jgi:hypothetical protein
LKLPIQVIIELKILVYRCAVVLPGVLNLNQSEVGTVTIKPEGVSIYPINFTVLHSSTDSCYFCNNRGIIDGKAVWNYDFHIKDWYLTKSVESKSIAGESTVTAVSRDKINVCELTDYSGHNL